MALAPSAEITTRWAALRHSIAGTPLRRLFWVYLLTRLAVGLTAWLTTLAHGPQLSGITLASGVRGLAPWDARWYISIAAWGDHTSAFRQAEFLYHDYGFFPLFPLLVGGIGRLIALTSYSGLALVGIVLSTLLLWPAAALLYRYSEGILGPRIAERAVTYLLIFPFSFVFSMVYTESLFLFLTVLGFMAMQRQRVVAGALAGTASAACRLNGVLFVVPAMIIGLRGGRPLRLAWLALIPLALLAYVGYLDSLTGSFAALPHANIAWGRGVMVPWKPITGAVSNLIVPPVPSTRLNPAVALCMIALFGWLMVEVVRRRREYGAEHVTFCALSIAVVLISGNYLSFGRYEMVVFPFMWALAGATLGRPWAHRALIALFPALLVGFTILAVSAQLVP